jgi:hypothetical protein
MIFAMKRLSGTAIIIVKTIMEIGRSHIGWVLFYVGVIARTTPDEPLR